MCWFVVCSCRLTIARQAAKELKYHSLRSLHSLPFLERFVSTIPAAELLRERVLQFFFFFFFFVRSLVVDTALLSSLTRSTCISLRCRLCRIYLISAKPYFTWYIPFLLRCGALAGVRTSLVSLRVYNRVRSLDGI